MVKNNLIFIFFIISSVLIMTILVSAGPPPPPPIPSMDDLEGNDPDDIDKTAKNITEEEETRKRAEEEQEKSEREQTSQKNDTEDTQKIDEEKPDTLENENNDSSSLPLIIGGIMALGGLGSGGYFYLKMKNEVPSENPKIQENRPIQDDTNQPIQQQERPPVQQVQQQLPPLDPKTETYLNQCRSSGMTPDQIRQQLTQAGWNPQDVENILRYY